MRKILRTRTLAGLTLAILVACPTAAADGTVTERIARLVDQLDGQAVSCPEDLDRFGDPAAALEARMGGVVVARLLIREDGSVGQICLMNVDPPGYGFDQAAVQALGQWRFTPATVDGTAVASYSIQYVAWSVGSP